MSGREDTRSDGGGPSTTTTTTLTEGKATIDLPGSVDFNPVQEFDRDLSIAVLQQYVEDRPNKTNGVSVLDAFAGCGIRAIRYAKEVSGVGQVIANDCSQNAVDSVRKNAETNGVADIVTPKNMDAIELMCHHRINDKFHVVDIDPPDGSALKFLDASVQCVADGGILMVTCSDMEQLCGGSPGECSANYGSMSIRAGCSPEIALRILLRRIESTANMSGRYLEPLLSVGVDSYIRVFVRVFTGAAEAKKSCCKTGMIFQCSKCELFLLQPLAKQSPDENDGISNASAPASFQCSCGGKQLIAGPIWTGPLYDINFIRQLLERVNSNADLLHLKNKQRICDLLSAVSEELYDVPLYYILDRLANLLHYPVPPFDKFRAAIEGEKYRISASHSNPRGFKTDAPIHVILQILGDLSGKRSPTSSPVMAARPKHYDMFISHRRYYGNLFAAWLKSELAPHGWRLFLDVDELVDTGVFTDELRSAIANSDVFVLLLTAGCLDRCGEIDDPVRLEIECALEMKKPIVPVFDESFRFPGKDTTLPDSVKTALKRIGIPYIYIFRQEAINRLLRSCAPHVTGIPPKKLQIKIDTVQNCNFLSSEFTPQFLVHTGNMKAYSDLQKLRFNDSLTEFTEYLNIRMQSWKHSDNENWMCRYPCAHCPWLMSCAELHKYARDELEISFKVFLSKTDYNHIRACLVALKEDLVVQHVDNIILKLPSTGRTAISELKELWPKLETLAREETAELGLADVLPEDINDVWPSSFTKPSIIQYSCTARHILPELKQFADQHGIKLMEHRDPNRFLRNEQLRSILEQCLQVHPTLAANWIASWVGRYEIILKRIRNVVGKGYVVNFERKKA